MPPGATPAEQLQVSSGCGRRRVASARRPEPATATPSPIGTAGGATGSRARGAPADGWNAMWLVAIGKAIAQRLLPDRVGLL